MSYGFLCCGPSTLYNVADSSDDDDSDRDEAEVLDPRALHASDGGRSPRSRQHAKAEPRQRIKPTGLIGRIAEGWQAIFTVPSRRRRNADLYPLLYPDSTRGLGGGARPGPDPTVLNLAYRETHRLPDVAGEEKVAWAAGIQRVDLTETGIRTLRGLDAFPNVHTLVLDSNGLSGLPDSPWVPRMETLWMCNNEVENLDGLLDQVLEAFPSLTSLALMGNPVWPAAKNRILNAPTYAAMHDPEISGDEAASKKSQARSSPGGIGEGEEAGGRQPRRQAPVTSDDEDSQEAEYRMRVLRRLPRLKTLDCTDVSPEERRRASPPDPPRSISVDDLVAEPEPMTDTEGSLASNGGVGSSSFDVGLYESEKNRRDKLRDRGSLPSTWIKEAVVMDVGSSWTKMGLAGQEKPTCCFPTVVGRMDLRAYDRVTGQDEKVFVGHKAIIEANKRVSEREIPTGRPMPRPILLQRPMSCGVVNDWDDIEEIWRYGIEEMMGLDAMEHPVLMADSTATPPGAREKATEILFETMTTPAVHMALQPVLALYACGPSSGLVVDIGDSGTQIAPIYDGFLLEKGVRLLNLGGKDVTRQLAALVNAQICLQGGEEFDADDPRDVVKLETLKANMCFVSENVEKENARMELGMRKPYVLPDGTRVTLGRERYRSAELLFDPAIALRQELSLQAAILNSILACERKTWPVLAQTVILTGGTTELQGLNRRLQRELTKARRAHGIKLKFTVMVPEDDHNNTVWLGGSMLAAMGQLDGLWFTRAEYEEYGSGPIHAKFAA